MIIYIYIHSILQHMYIYIYICIHTQYTTIYIYVMYVGYIAVSRLRFFLWPPLGDHSPHFPSTIGSSGFRTTGNCSERLVHFPSHPPERSPKEKTQKNPPIVFDHYKKCQVDFWIENLESLVGKDLESPKPFSVTMKCRPSARQLVRSTAQTDW